MGRRWKSPKKVVEKGKEVTQKRRELVKEGVKLLWMRKKV